MEESNNHMIPMDSLQGSYLPSTTQSSLEIGSSKKDLIDDESEVKEGNVISRLVVSCRKKLHRLYIKNSQLYWLLFKTLLNIALIVYLVAAVLHWYYNGRKPLDWCRGNGMILVLFAFIAWVIIYYKLLKPFVFAYIKQNCCTSFSSFKIVSKIFRIFKRIIIFIIIIGILVFLVLDTVHSRQRLVSAVGLFVFIMLGFIFSQHPNQIKWKTVFMGILIQIVLGLLVIRWEVGRAVFMCIGNRVETFLQFGYKGATFVYGDFIVNKLAVFAFQALSVIFFLSTVIEICFYFGWLQTICFKLGWIMQTVLGTTIIESVNAVTTVFLGLSEAPLLYKPYIKDLTVSEMHAVMAGGFSTAAGSVFAAYTALGVNPSYVITASIMAAPAALCFAKLLYPETELSKTSVDTFVPYKSEERSVVDAACKGALAAINLVTGIIATVIACVSLVSFIDSAIAWFASMLGVEGFTFEYLVGKILTPIPYIMGVSPDQCEYVAKLIGIKITLNEFIAYQELGKLKQANLLSPRSEAMATFALCSFSNPGGLASFIALLINLCPQKKEMVTRVAIRALISGITTGLLTATIAGALMPEEGFGIICDSCSNSNHTSVTLPIT